MPIYAIYPIVAIFARWALGTICSCWAYRPWNPLYALGARRPLLTCVSLVTLGASCAYFTRGTSYTLFALWALRSSGAGISGISLVTFRARRAAVAIFAIIPIISCNTTFPTLALWPLYAL